MQLLTSEFIVEMNLPLLVFLLQTTAEAWGHQAVTVLELGAVAGNIDDSNIRTFLCLLSIFMAALAFLLLSKRLRKDNRGD